MSENPNNPQPQFNQAPQYGQQATPVWSAGSVRCARSDP